MLYYIIKTIISAVLIVAISEISKRFSFIGALLASVPLTSVLAILWLYNETKDIEKIAELSSGIFWLVIPSLSFFIVLPLLLQNKLSFYLSMALSLVIMIIFYFLMVLLLKQIGVKI
jgi:hypothetical protein